MSIDRRLFLKQFASAGGGAMLTPSLTGLIACNRASTRAGRATHADGRGFGSADPRNLIIKPYGDLVPGADCPELEIPESFRCVRLSSGGLPSTVRDGLTVPNAFDGMAAFPLPNGNVRLVRNHEMIDEADKARPIGQPAYDVKGSGGTTSLEVRISEANGRLTVELVDEFVSLAGTRYKLRRRSHALGQLALVRGSHHRPPGRLRAAPRLHLRGSGRSRRPRGSGPAQGHGTLHPTRRSP